MRFHVSPVSVKTILLANSLVVQDDKRDVSRQEEEPGEHDEYHVVPCPILVGQDNLAENNTVFKEAHEDEPVWN